MFKYMIDEDIELGLLEHYHANEILESMEYSRDSLRKWLPWVDGVKTIEDEIEFIDMAKTQYTYNKGFQAGIWYQGMFAGMIGYHDVNWRDRSVSIGYWLDKRFTGRGIMTKACRAMINYAFYAYGLNRVEIRCAKENAKSRAIPERLGFMKEGMIRQAEWLYDHYVDHVVYGILLKDWENHFEYNL